MNPDDDPVALLAAVFERAGLAYALIGGHAVNMWLEPRFTVDVTVVADPGALARARAGLEAAGYQVATEHGADLPSGPDFVRFTRGSDAPPIELQVAKTGLQEELIVQRRCKESRRIPVPGLEGVTHVRVRNHEHDRVLRDRCEQFVDKRRREASSTNVDKFCCVEVKPRPSLFEQLLHEVHGDHERPCARASCQGRMVFRFRRARTGRRRPGRRRCTS